MVAHQRNIAKPQESAMNFRSWYLSKGISHSAIYLLLTKINDITTKHQSVKIGPSHNVRHKKVVM